MGQTDARPTLVLLPGMDGSGLLFDSLIAALGERFQICRIAYPAEEALAYPELEEIARRALPVDGEFILLGESFSGPIAIALAASAPPGLRGLILCSTFARNPHPLFKPLHWLVNILPVKQLPHAILAYFLMGRFATPALRAALERALSPVSAAAFRARLKAVLTVDTSARLERLQLPLLYLQASHDLVVSASSGRHIKALYPAAEVQRFDAPHFLLQTAAPAAAATIQSFISKIMESRKQANQVSYF